MIAATATLSEEKAKKFYDFTNILRLEFLKNNKKRIAVVRLQGVIGKVGGPRGSGMTIESMNSLIEKAFNSPKTVAVCLCVNSPGGSPVQSELIAKRIIELSKSKNIPVYAFIEDVAASGGYWLACSASEIYASKSSIVGSIGVISAGFGMVDAISKLGVERRVYTSGKNKSVLDPFLPAKQDDVKLIKKIQEGVHKHFIDYIKTRRAGKLTQDDDILFNGEFWNGDIAYDFGLIDGIDDLYNFIKRKFGDKVKLDYISQNESWFKKKMGIISQSFVENLSSQIKFDIVQTIKDSKYDISG